MSSSVKCEGEIASRAWAWWGLWGHIIYVIKSLWAFLPLQHFSLFILISLIDRWGTAIHRSWLDWQIVITCAYHKEASLVLHLNCCKCTERCLTKRNTNAQSLQLNIKLKRLMMLIDVYSTCLIWQYEAVRGKYTHLCQRYGIGRLNAPYQWWSWSAVDHT